MVSAYQLEVVRKRTREPASSVNSSDETARRFAYLEKYDRERLIRVDLDGQNRVVGEEVVSIGTVSSTVVGPRKTCWNSLCHAIDWLVDRAAVCPAATVLLAQIRGLRLLFNAHKD